MSAIAITFFANEPGTYIIQDDGILGNNISQIVFPNGVVIPFEHPTDNLNFQPTVPGVNLVVNFTDALGTANFTAGNLTDPAQSPDSIAIQSVQTSGTVTLVSNGSITEGTIGDAAVDIVAGELILSANSGIGTSGDSLETQTSVLEAETGTGGITISNAGAVTIGGLTNEVNGLSVSTSGDLFFTNLGSISLSDLTGSEKVFDASGNIILIANGTASDISATTDSDAITAQNGNILLDAGRDVLFGTTGVSNDNDVRASGSITVNAGRDFAIEGFSDMASDDFGLNTGGNVTITAGRNIGILNAAGDASVGASGNGGGDVILTTGSGGTFTLTAPFNALFSDSGNITINSNRMLIGVAAQITANTGIVTLAPATAGWAINLGSITDAALALELSDAELDLIFADTLIVGTNTAGPVTVSAPITLANTPELIIRSGNDIDVLASITTTTSLSLRALDDVTQSGATTITTGTLTVFVDAVDNDPGTGGTLTFGGAVVASGTVITGNLDADTLGGTAVNDIIRGFAGDDTMNGGLGNDSIFGGDGFDSIVGGDGDDELRGNLNADTISGGDGNDSLFGGNGHDVLDGGNGNDLLTGALGHDQLTGGAGLDIFIYQSTDESKLGVPDQILDFVTGDDKIDLSLIDANSGSAGDQPFTFIGAAAFSNSAGELRSYASGPGSWFVEGDVDGDGLADLRIEVFTPANPATPLVNTDFFL